MHQAIGIEIISELPFGYLEYGDFSFAVSCYAQPCFDKPVELWPTQPVAPFNKVYPLAPFLNDDGETFLARYQGEAVGHITLSKNWNDYTLIEEIAVSRHARRQGIATALLDAARHWAREQDTAGLMLETQNNNLTACSCYQRYGFVLGGIDHLLYRGQPDIADHEIALFWYLPFNNEVGY
ncbi:GNAT family N-acetyltransferase [Serratia fonticola]|mgnify:CR=1 FL=1|uniref:TDP-fucosamine acetyltransferase n=1 Tax=Serratia fonticola TaxID=47917 RepID=A0A0F7D2D1_SERFO|nr:GNAT family N-acetyltransferase [Serratia fonticola]AKG70525.1 GCN5 family acetyltransferase [Serratia fonticola]MBL5859252.1 GNAT family N-acetyltransferase [Serratia fonticola]MBL5901891.1 GNAT family N-acetyltransferase [Serratia fonticola]MDK2373609.1 GNAT family N-acetyltransferase [Serratia fonticola]NTY86330.1 GNAT family N-acetyltransferase [Serratia fonticola]